MPNEPNPLAGVRDVGFTRHALFRMKDLGMTEYDVFRSITSPSAQAKIDRKSGHLVFDVGPFIVVARKDTGDHATVLTCISSDSEMP